MSDREKINLLMQRLDEVERRAATPEQRSILDVARDAIESELEQLSRRLFASSYIYEARGTAA